VRHLRTVSTTPITFGRLGSLRPRLSEAARTDESNAEQAVDRFVELRPGLAETLGSSRNHLITGRRGTGKSTLLHLVRRQLRAENVAVAVIDMERYKGRAFPDVLIEILIALLDEVQPRVRFAQLYGDLRLRWSFRRTRRELSKLLQEPQQVLNNLQRVASRGSERNLAAKAAIATRGTEASGKLARKTSSVESLDQTAQFVELKIERLQALASRISGELRALVERSAQRRAIVFIDDFYFVRLADQPWVLDYLQQVCKGTGTWLKVGGVGTRMNTFIDGDPPTGMQPNQDIDLLPIDIALDGFSTAQRFLEEMLDGVLTPLDCSTRQLFTDTARSRMVLACGGAVARDYITLTTAALDVATDRLSKKGRVKDDDEIKIQTEDVNTAARRRVNEKEEKDLQADAGSDASKFRDRWRDMCDFVREQGNSAFVLVRQRDLDQADWGAEIRQLENLRLLHRIRDTVPNTPNWRGVKTVVFMIDLGQVANTRLRAGIPEFWKNTAQFDKLRRAEWVYLPEWRDKLALKPAAKIKTAQTDGEDDREIADDQIPTLFDSPPE
jgi:hypothetical protein